MLSIDLLNFVDAKVVEIDGERGVFIPERLNCDEKKSKYYGNEEHMFVSVSLNRSTIKRKNDWYGKQVLPASLKDRALETPELIPRCKTVAWGFEGKNIKAKFNPAEFNRIKDDD